MSRQLKFRAYLDDFEEMFYRVWLVESQLYVDLDGKPWDVLELDDRVHVMQYTGLKDNNGREIYEGDIVSFEDSDGGYEYQDIVINTGIVEYGELGFYFTNRVAVEMDDFYIKDGRCDDIEVIGNIYENPELIPEVPHA